MCCCNKVIPTVIDTDSCTIFALKKYLTVLFEGKTKLLTIIDLYEFQSRSGFSIDPIHFRFCQRHKFLSLEVNSVVSEHPTRRTHFIASAPTQADFIASAPRTLSFELQGGRVSEFSRTNNPLASTSSQMSYSHASVDEEKQHVRL